jgi:hypothetical protein
MELTGYGEFTPIKLRASTTRTEETPEMIAAVETAIERVKARKDETAEEWAGRVGPTFFADLEE